ncbi:MAG: mechanosensitive ion channel family protein [Bacteroidia bacterium]|nr:mechanosensitive ion channel family protein [Bacteroidia bacterium]NNJ55081.1 mechanosensitive ion channel family protein [Bacteroidia bacterium]
MKLGNQELISIAIIVVGSYALVTIGKYVIRRYLQKTYNDPTDKEFPVTSLNFFYNTFAFLVYTIAVMAIIYTIPQFKHIGKTLFAGAGIFAAIIGFASQQAFSNIIGGVFLVLFKPFRVGDLIRVGQINEGYVEDITLRHTVIKDFENKRIVIPNSLISTETIHNSTLKDPRVLNRIPFGISYDSNVELAISIIRKHAKQHSLQMDYRSEIEKQEVTEDIDVRVISWDDSSITLRAYIWTESQHDGFMLRTDLYQTVKKDFEENGIEIPFPHRTIVYKNHEQKEKI